MRGGEVGERPAGAGEVVAALEDQEGQERGPDLDLQSESEMVGMKSSS